MPSWFVPARLAAGAAARFVREHGVGRAARLGLAGLATLGPRGLIRRAAAEARRREDDARYRRWAASHTPTGHDLERLRAEISGWPVRPRVSVITAVFNTPPDLLRRCIESVRAQVYPDWELCLCDDGSTDVETIAAVESLKDDPKMRVLRSSRRGGIVQASNAALATATGEFVGFLDHDDELAPDALAEVVKRLTTEPDLDAIYTDEDKIDDAGTRREPHFKPDWSPELLRSCMYISHFTVIRRSVVEEAGALRPETDGAQDYDLMLRVAARTSRIGHVPAVLYHWRMTAGSAAASELGKPWAAAAGQRALEEDLRRRGLPGDVRRAGAAGHYRVRYALRGAPQVALIRNDGRSSLGPSPRRNCDHLLFLDTNVRAPSRESMRALLELGQQDDIGAVGPIVLRYDGTIESAGLVLTRNGVPLGAFAGEPHWTRGHLSNILDVRNCAAVSGACLMTRRSVFEQVGGVDPDAGPLWDVDYCLRVRAAGLRVAITPHARVRRTAAHVPALRPAEPLERLGARWGALLERDPYYNPNFDQRAATFRLASPEHSAKA